MLNIPFIFQFNKILAKQTKRIFSVAFFIFFRIIVPVMYRNHEKTALYFLTLTVLRFIALIIRLLHF